MAGGISGLGSAGAISIPREVATGGGPAGISFAEVLERSINEVNQLDREAQGAIAESLTGGEITQAEVFASVKKADLALRTMLQIRNKLLDAYNELKQLRM